MRRFYSVLFISAVCFGAVLVYEGTDATDRDEVLDRVNREHVSVEPVTKDVIPPLSGALSVPNGVSVPDVTLSSSAPQAREFASNGGDWASGTPISIGPYRDPEDPTSIDSGEVIIIGEYRDPEPEGDSWLLR